MKYFLDISIFTLCVYFTFWAKIETETGQELGGQCSVFVSCYLGRWLILYNF